MQKHNANNMQLLRYTISVKNVLNPQRHNWHAKKLPPSFIMHKCWWYLRDYPWWATIYNLWWLFYRRKYQYQRHESTKWHFDKSLRFSLRPTRVFRGSLWIDGYLWFVQYDNHKEITLKDFRLFMSKKNTNGGFDFNDVVNYIGVSFSDIPQVGFWFFFSVASIVATGVQDKVHVF